jgi:HSP20 family molecular chaperone IbpA
MVHPRADVLAAALAAIFGGAMWVLAVCEGVKRAGPGGPRVVRRSGSIPGDVRDRASFSAAGSGRPSGGTPSEEIVTMQPIRRYPSWCPTVVVERDRRCFVIRAELSGIDRDELRLEVYDDALVVRGNWTRDAAAGSFCRSVTLPWDADTDRVAVTFESDLLTVSAPLARREGPGGTKRRPEATNDPHAASRWPRKGTP